MYCHGLLVTHHADVWDHHGSKYLLHFVLQALRPNNCSVKTLHFFCVQQRACMSDVWVGLLYCSIITLLQHVGPHLAIRQAHWRHSLYWLLGASINISAGCMALGSSNNFWSAGVDGLGRMP